jgi:Uma2 family endonuclease
MTTADGLDDEDFDDEDALVNGVLRPTGPMTEGEFLDWCDDDVRAEWVDGEVVIFDPAHYKHCRIVGWLLCVMGLYVEDRDLGEVLVTDYLIRLARQRRMRLPDLLFVAKERRDLITEMYLEGPPDLIVEVVSPDSQSRDRHEKFLEYEAAGVREYWMIDFTAEEVEVHTLDGDGRYRAIPAYEGRVASTVLPGFWIKTEWLWQRPPRSEWETLREFSLPR